MITNNPFQLTSRPTTKATPPRKPARWPVFIGTAAGLLGLWLLSQSSVMPQPIRSMLHPWGDNRVFAGSMNFSRDKARALYRQALTDLNDGNSQKALEEFKQLESLYPGLEDMLWLHEAECYAAQGNEWAVQKKLNNLISTNVDSPLKTVALYRIGQSQVRGSEWQQAKTSFDKIRQMSPNSDYALGSLYYQGLLLAKDKQTQAQAVSPLMQYLSECPNCKFSGDAAEHLEKLLPHPTAAEHSLIGLAEASSSKDLKKTLSHLNQGTHALTWLALGKTQISAGQRQAGVQTLIQGLPEAKDDDSAHAAVDAILAHTPDATQQVATLNTLAQQHLKIGGDYLLWKLAEADSSNANSHYQTLVQDYPQSDYAPESGWRLLWPVLNSGNTSSYLSQAQHYLSQYPYARSAPKALFWIAKLQEGPKPLEATAAYNRLMEQYPSSYYAFRAKGRLKVLTGGKPDSGWVTSATRSDYPPTETDLNGLDILPSPEQFADGELGRVLRSQARELQAIGAADDVRLLVGESLHGDLPPAVASWAEQVSGDRAKGMRTIRDALDKQTKAVFLANANNTRSVKPAGTPDEMKLLYPVYFSQPVLDFGSKNKVDPYLIQALMREESYFNEFAISGSNARGLMQLLPTTARDVAGWENLPHFQTSDLFVPEVNIRLGSRYLGYLHQLFNGNAMPAVGAYNGGPNAMKRWVSSSTVLASDPDMFVERIPYEQSRDYIKKVFAGYWNYTRLYCHSNR
jgi:soluble lytic murein transglycosylase